MERKKSSQISERKREVGFSNSNVRKDVHQRERHARCIGSKSQCMFCLMVC